MNTYKLKERPDYQPIQWPLQTPGEAGDVAYPTQRSTKVIAPGSHVILETNDDVQLCVVVEQNNEGTKFTGRVIEVYPPGTLTVRGAGKDADQLIDFTDQDIFTVQHLEQSAAKA